jgi:hypothetical protein
VASEPVFDGVAAELGPGPGSEQRIMGAELFGKPAAQHRDGQRGQWSGALFAAPAQAAHVRAGAKRRYQASYFDCVRLRDGLIVERVQQADVLAQMRQAYGRMFGVVGIGAMLLRQKA